MKIKSADKISTYPGHAVSVLLTEYLLPQLLKAVAQIGATLGVRLPPLVQLVHVHRVRRLQFLLQVLVVIQWSVGGTVDRPMIVVVFAAATYTAVVTVVTTSFGSGSGRRFVQFSYLWHFGISVCNNKTDGAVFVCASHYHIALMHCAYNQGSNSWRLPRPWPSPFQVLPWCPQILINVMVFLTMCWPWSS